MSKNPPTPSEHPSSQERDDPDWFVYILRTRRDSLYTGIATDVERRLAEHAEGGRKGARSLRGQAPLELVFQGKIGTRSEALRVEARIKRLPKKEKEQLVAASHTPRTLRAALGV